MDRSTSVAAPAGTARGEVLYALSPDLVWFASADGVVDDANPAALALLGWDLDGPAIRAASAYTVASRAVIEVDATQALRGRRTWTGDLTLRSAAGEAVPVSVVMVAHHEPDGRLAWVATVARDQRRSAAVERELRHQARHDSLTGMANRDGFNAAAAVAVSAGPCAVLQVDIDHLRTVNETLGHDAGDALVVEVARRLRQVLRDRDVAARIGGDEFVILLPGVDRTGAVTVAERVLTSFEPPVRVAGRDLHASVSIGVATAAAGDGDPDRLVQHADLATYLAKSSGRGRAEVYDERAHQRVIERAQLRQDLAGALDRRELHLVYQPIVSLGDGRVTGVEALLRWHHPTAGAVGPVSFVPLLEETGLIVEVGRWVLTEALQQLAAWDAAGLPAMSVSVNVSAHQLGPALVTDVAAALAATGIAAERLTVELTETALVHDLEVATALLAELRASGVRVALDDFGTGYSSLGSLQSLPIDQLKIDRSFVHALERTGDTALIAGICQMATALGMRSVAEGIEDQREAVTLGVLGCDAGQGYWWSRPLPADELATLVARG